VGAVLVHEFATLDGVIEAPTWTVDFGFDPKMGESIAELTDRSSAILLGRNTYEMFEPAWSTRTEEDDPGAPFFNDTQAGTRCSRAVRERRCPSGLQGG
jgi:RibD domain-containing protein